MYDVGAKRLARSWRRVEATLRQLDIFVRNQISHGLFNDDLLRPVYAIYELTWRCNLDCSYCDNGAGDSYPRRARRVRPLPVDEVFRLLARLRRDVPAIYVTGGEPTVHPHFPEIMREIDRLGFHPVMVNTNGIHLPALLKRDPGLFGRIDILIFSLDAMDAGILDGLLRGRRGDGQRALDAFALCLDHAQAAGCTVGVNCVITRATVDHARAVMALCRERGIPFMPVPANRGKGLLEPLADLPDFRALVAETLGEGGPRPLGPREVIDIMMLFRPFECHPALRIHITPDGRVPWPCQSDEQLSLAILDYPSVRAMLRAAEARFSVQKHGRRCGGPCYLAQNISTHVYLHRPLSTISRLVRDFVVRGMASQGSQQGQPRAVSAPR